ncbi:hypothetical protein RB653_003889 [Dictyostelium firmibasis]|uniref:Kri1-like C-terminal domain-containing protein n=1 Tax=Dictyostelium firmibasis TaxID=79012 RepID=A0AAN7YXI1_9MYCE
MSDSSDSESSSSSYSSSSSSSSSENESIKEEKKVLFQDDSDSDSAETEIKVNKKYEKMYEAKKAHNELISAATTLEEDEVSEDDDGKFDSKEMNDGFLTLLPLLAKRRTELLLKNKDIKFFDSNNQQQEASGSDDEADSESEESESENKKKKKPFTLKDYQREKLAKTMNKDQYEESDEEKYDGDEEDFDALPHNKQQEKLKKDFLEASKRSFKNEVNNKNDSDDNDDSSSSSSDDDLLVKRKKSEEDQEVEDREFEEFRQRLEKKKSPFVEETETISEFWKGKDANNDEKFLRDYLLGQKWQSDKGKLPTYEEILKELDQDEGETIKQDDFERTYNFRFEEPGSAIIVSHPRTVENSVRRKDSARKTKREKKKERKEQRAVQNQEKIKQLKNEKKKQILEKVKEINSITGSSLFNLDSVDIKKIDPELMVKSIGKKVKQQDNNNYNNEEYDENYEGGEDDYQYDEGGGSGRFDFNKVIESGLYDDQFEDDGEVWSNERMSKEREELESMLDRYYEMDYQDLLGDDTPVRFKYTKVDPDSTISVDDILEKDDKDLEKILPLNKIATYYNPSYKGYREKADKRYFDKSNNNKYLTKSSKPSTNYNSKYNQNKQFNSKFDKNNNNDNNNNNNNSKFNNKNNNNNNNNKNNTKEEFDNNKKDYNNKQTTTTTTTTTETTEQVGEKKRKAKNKNKVSANKIQKVE